MKFTNRLGTKLNPKTRKLEPAIVEVDIPVTAIRRPALAYFVAEEAMEIPTANGLVEVAEGDYVVVGETGIVKTYTKEAFERAYVEGAASPGGPAAAIDTETRGRVDVVEGSLRNTVNVVTQQGVEIDRIKAQLATLQPPPQG